MQTLANIFLIVFLNAAGLGIADAILSVQFDLGTLTAISDFATGLAIFFGLTVYAGFAFNRHLPKPILIPLIAYLFWGMLDYWPLEPLVGSNYLPLAACLQLLLGLAILHLNRKLNGKSRLLTVSQFAGPAFSGRNLLRFCLVNIFLLPVVILILGFSTISDLLEEQSAGFMRLKPDGLYMIEKVYRKGAKQVRLAGMIHLGQPDYFDRLSETLAGQQTILLAEGVSDKTDRLEGEFSYQKLAELLGLASQEQMLVAGRLVTAESLAELDDMVPGQTDILAADIDLAEFDEQTIAMLNALGRYILSSDSLAEGFAEFNRWSKENTNVETNHVVMQDLIEKRNRVLLSYLPQALKKYDTVVIPWGALHMPGLETAIRHKGFALDSQQERLSINFLLLPYEKLWESSP